jgi:hypothetical protein
MLFIAFKAEATHELAILRSEIAEQRKISADLRADMDYMQADHDKELKTLSDSHERATAMLSFQLTTTTDQLAATKQELETITAAHVGMIAENELLQRMTTSLERQMMFTEERNNKRVDNINSYLENMFEDIIHFRRRVQNNELSLMHNEDLRGQIINRLDHVLDGQFKEVFDAHVTAARVNLSLPIDMTVFSHRVVWSLHDEEVRPSRRASHMPAPASKDTTAAAVEDPSKVDGVGNAAAQPNPPATEEGTSAKEPPKDGEPKEKSAGGDDGEEHSDEEHEKEPSADAATVADSAEGCLLRRPALPEQYAKMKNIKDLKYRSNWDNVSSKSKRQTKHSQRTSNAASVSQQASSGGGSKATPPQSANAGGGNNANDPSSVSPVTSASASKRSTKIGNIPVSNRSTKQRSKTAVDAATAKSGGAMSAKQFADQYADGADANKDDTVGDRDDTVASGGTRRSRGRPGSAQDGLLGPLSGDGQDGAEYVPPQQRKQSRQPSARSRPTTPSDPAAAGTQRLDSNESAPGVGSNEDDSGAGIYEDLIEEGEEDLEEGTDEGAEGEEGDDLEGQEFSESDQGGVVQFTLPNGDVVTSADMLNNDVDYDESGAAISGKSDYSESSVSSAARAQAMLAPMMKFIGKQPTFRVSNLYL